MENEMVQISIIRYDNLKKLEDSIVNKKAISIHWSGVERIYYVTDKEKINEALLIANESLIKEKEELNRIIKMQDKTIYDLSKSLTEMSQKKTFWQKHFKS
jgi:hypothetical protein